MIGSMPDYMKSEYYRQESENAYDDSLAECAPDELKKMFEEMKNSYPSFVRIMKKAFPDIQNPYYTWDGKVVEKDSR